MTHETASVTRELQERKQSTSWRIVSLRAHDIFSEDRSRVRDDGQCQSGERSFSEVTSSVNCQRIPNIVLDTMTKSINEDSSCEDLQTDTRVEDWTRYARERSDGTIPCQLLYVEWSRLCSPESTTVRLTRCCSMDDYTDEIAEMSEQLWYRIAARVTYGSWRTKNRFETFDVHCSDSTVTRTWFRPSVIVRMTKRTWSVSIWNKISFRTEWRNLNLLETLFG